MNGLEYKIMNAPCKALISAAARMKFNHAIVYSLGIEGRGKPCIPETADDIPIYFDSYPKVVRHRREHFDAKIREESSAIDELCDFACENGLSPVIHSYESYLPMSFIAEHPELVGIWRRKSQSGDLEFGSSVNPDNPETWKLFEEKYFELAKRFSKVEIFIMTTWDGSGTHLCAVKAKMPVAERLANLAKAANDGIKRAGTGARLCFRLWGRTFPRDHYLHCHELISKVTGIANAGELMEQVSAPHNDPEIVLPELFKRLPQGVPVMFKSTKMDIGEKQPLTDWLGKFPSSIPQILEVSFEAYHTKPWPWCKIGHIRKGIEAVRENNLAGIVALPISMGLNYLNDDPENSGNLGRMNTWLFEKIFGGDKRGDMELVGEWVEKEFASKVPEWAIKILLDAEHDANEAIEWGSGICARVVFASPHTTRLYWIFDGFVDKEFSFKIVEPSEAFLNSLLEMKNAACERIQKNLKRMELGRNELSDKFYAEAYPSYQVFANFAELCRDWHSYIVTLYGIEKGVFKPSRENLAKMSRYVETFIVEFAAMQNSPVGEIMLRNGLKMETISNPKLSFPDNFRSWNPEK